jgi:hypothetical protein
MLQFCKNDLVPLYLLDGSRILIGTIKGAAVENIFAGLNLSIFHSHYGQSAPADEQNIATNGLCAIAGRFASPRDSMKIAQRFVAGLAFSVKRPAYR